MDSCNNPFLLADDYYDEDDGNTTHHINQDNIYGYNNGSNNVYNYNTGENSPKLINKTWLDELNSYFKLNNLINGIRSDTTQEPKHDISISNTVMNSIINKKLGTVTYHNGNTKSYKAYHTIDYPELYYNKQIFSNVSEWLKKEFSKKI
jgi:hypothetical protein